jgi:hypothetical protein
MRMSYADDTYEMLKHAVLDMVKEFYCLGLQADVSMTDAENRQYRLHVLSLAPNPFRASLLWLVQRNAITQARQTGSTRSTNIAIFSLTNW